MTQEFLKTGVEIKRWLKGKGVKKYHLVPDGLGGFIVDTDGDVTLYDLDNFIDSGAGHLPVQFGHIKGDFYCSHSELRSLKGCPHTVDKSFTVSNNKVSSLEYGPSHVGDNYSVEYAQLTSLVGAPKNIPKLFNCIGNKLVNLIGAPLTVEGSFFCSVNPLVNFEGCPQVIGGAFVCLKNGHLKSLEYFPDYIEECATIDYAFETGNLKDCENLEDIYRLHWEHKNASFEKRQLEEILVENKIDNVEDFLKSKKRLKI